MYIYIYACGGVVIFLVVVDALVHKRKCANNLYFKQ